MTSHLMMKIFPDNPDSYPDDSFDLSNISSCKIPAGEDQYRALLQIVEEYEDVHFRSVELVYVDEKEITRINREFLNHNYVTDIITFRYDEGQDSAIEATLYCCAPRIQEQSKEFGTEEASEFLRVFVHGLIHLAGYNDETKSEKARMTELENRYLELLGDTR